MIVDDIYGAGVPALDDEDQANDAGSKGVQGRDAGAPDAAATQDTTESRDKENDNSSYDHSGRKRMIVILSDQKDSRFNDKDQK